MIALIDRREFMCQKKNKALLSAIGFIAISFYVYSQMSF